MNELSISRWRRRHLADEAGMVAPLFAILLVVLVGFVSLAVDWGRMHEERRLLQNAVDGAALAATRELVNGGPPSCDNQAAATDMAMTYLQLNGVVEGGPFNTLAPVIDFDSKYAPCDTITVWAHRDVPTVFARVIGIDETPVSATAMGIVGSLGSPPQGVCVMPLAVLQGVPGEGGPNGLPFTFWDPGDPSTEYQMKQNADGSWSGNRQGTDLYGMGDDFFDALRGNCPDGASQPVVGEFYSTVTGNWGNNFVDAIETRVSGEATPWTNDLYDYAHVDGNNVWYPNAPANSFEDASPRFVYVPIFYYQDVQDCEGSACYIQLKGVALFFITFLGCEDEGNLTPFWESCPPGKGILKGVFLQTWEPGGKWTSWNQYGVTTVRLWQ